jgi:glycosyltransferase involved in cell wall biosynthesis
MGVVQAPTVGVLITTKNRLACVRNAIQSALDQTVKINVYVIDDGSTDGTPSMIRSEFPGVNLRSHAESKDVAARRNELASWASGEILFFLDDDATFSSPRVIDRTLQEFHHPRIGAVAIPFIDMDRQRVVRQCAPDPTHAYVTDSYSGGMVAFRRNTFLALGGYRPTLVHQFEEADLAIRLLDRGYVIRLGSSDPIHHFVSPERNRRRMGIFGARNNILFAWHNVPTRYLPIHLVGTSVKSIRAGFSPGHRRPDRALLGVLLGYLECIVHFSERRAVSESTYCLSRKIKKSRGTLLSEIENWPAPRSDGGIT